MNERKEEHPKISGIKKGTYMIIIKHTISDKNTVQENSCESESDNKDGRVTSQLEENEDKESNGEVSFEEVDLFSDEDDGFEFVQTQDTSHINHNASISIR